MSHARPLQCGSSSMPLFRNAPNTRIPKAYRMRPVVPNGYDGNDLHPRTSISRPDFAITHSQLP